MDSQRSKSIFFLVAVGCLFFAGVAAILYPMISNVYSLSTSRAVISSYGEQVANMPEQEKSDLLEKAKKYNSDLAKGIYMDGNEKALCDKEGLMCYVDIPSLCIYLPVYYGATDENLSKGCAFLENTSLPVGGKSTHCVISGHTGLPSAEMFTKLDQIKKGAEFYIHVLDQVLAYRVEVISVVTPEKTEHLGIFKNKDYCTLLTCTPYGINDKRLLVRGVRVEYKPPEPEKTEAQPSASETADDGLTVEINSQLAVIIAIAAAAVLLYAAGAVWLIMTICPPHRAKHAKKPRYRK